MTLKTYAIAAGAALALLPAVSHAQDREFGVGLITPPVHVWNQEVEAMGETLSELSDGRFSVTTFPSGQLGSEGTMLQQLQTGVLDMAWLTTAEVTTRVTDMSALHAPFLVTNIEDAARVLRSDVAREILDELPRATGAVGICYAMTGMRQMMSREAMTSAEDLDGMRFRITPAPPMRSFFEMFGAAPAPMPLTQVYDSLANGQIDAIAMDHESIINFGYYEHAPFMLETNHQIFPMVALVSGRVWAQLSPEDQEIVRTAVQTHCDATIDRFVEGEAGKLETLQAVDGLTIIENVGPEFFGDIVARWDAEWSEQTDYVERLRALADSF
ncbi:C4-dicarboxylate ABC transporter [Roseobacter sp. HKCCD9010]|uniref:TRAP transporter substrate-binding protein n=1 Tax=unclassified Roseobacter TaxID=196798 RepID=UPI00149158BD|nr:MULTISPECIES: TRAP transporter substrate-binding protein [unclassified Roseobacter]MBF9052332.1 C4-dicarboxylate ABC transporter [Rhodobacterales bacterium HKCCD4356]NNV14397.1 C4-dicarboxylate ABC transporter [Roseobacter sp. HKCCD7357]NNV18643.1 C4-dicarboxylate ABC transporter [Roseobacter sp. HKCCD8768]NNV28086.1 C4-dicarboxylate ABC transporter [Roseobacter sp. HKCCD8192]NNV32315.1 C4-dicarboxylate ABC transporter [Roseobacter sp. HKCCD9061]